MCDNCIGEVNEFTSLAIESNITIYITKVIFVVLLIGKSSFDRPKRMFA